MAHLLPTGMSSPAKAAPAEKSTAVDKKFDDLRGAINTYRHTLQNNPALADLNQTLGQLQAACIRRSGGHIAKYLIRLNAHAESSDDLTKIKNMASRLIPNSSPTNADSAGKENIPPDAKPAGLDLDAIQLRC